MGCHPKQTLNGCHQHTGRQKEEPLAWDAHPPNKPRSSAQGKTEVRVGMGCLTPKQALNGCHQHKGRQKGGPLAWDVPPNKP